MSLLTEPLNSAVLDELVDLERHVNDGSPTGRTFTDSVHPGSSPRFGSRYVHVPMLDLRNSEVEDIGLVRDYNVPGSFQIPIHPDVGPYLRSSALRQLQKTEDYIRAEPTAAGRTLLVREPRPHFIKLAYPGVLGRYAAVLDSQKVRGALACSRAVEEALEASSSRDPKFGLLREVGGRCANIMRDSSQFGSAACIYREGAVTHNSSPGRIRAIYPVFSLSARFTGGAEVLRKMWLASEVDEVSTFAWEYILEPLLSSLLHLATRWGLLPEPHAQNVLIALKDGSDSVEPLVVWRDALGFYCDMAVRSKTGAPEIADFVPRRVLRDEADAQRARSAYLDHMLWDYLLAPMFGPLRALGANDLQLIQQCRDLVADGLAMSGYLPKSAWWARPLEFPLPAERTSLHRIPGSSPTRK